MRRYARLVAVFSLLAALWALAHFSGMTARFTPESVSRSFAAHPIAGTALFVFLFSAGNLIQIPGWVFLVAAVVTLGELLGGIVTYVAASVSCVITFLLIRFVGGNALRTFKGKLAQRLFSRLDEHPVQSVGWLRLLFQTAPALNYALALSGIRFRSYLIGTLIGLPLPIALYCVFLDALARLLHWPLPG